MLSVILHNRTNCILVVVRNGNRICSCSTRDPRRTRYPKCRHAGACADEQAVTVPMIASDKFYDLIAPRISACEAKSAHCRFRPRIHHTNHFNGRIDVFDELCQLRLKESRSTIACPVRHGLLQCTYHLGMCMTDNHWSP